MAVPIRPITRVELVLKDLGLDITYAYDDLVFVEHNAFLLQFTDVGEMVNLYFNEESDGSKRDEIQQTLISAGEKQDLVITYKGTYTMEQLENEEMKLTIM